jgi:hypothetical protein
LDIKSAENTLEHHSIEKGGEPTKLVARCVRESLHSGAKLEKEDVSARSGLAVLKLSIDPPEF